MQKERKNWSYRELWGIAAEYGNAWALQKPLLSKLGTIYQESKLPYTKQKIKHALATLLLIEEDNEEISLLGQGYTQLGTFVGDDAYEFIRSKISVPYTAMPEAGNPPEEVLDKVEKWFELSKQDEDVESKIESDIKTEKTILHKELIILLQIIGDPNGIVESLEQSLE